MHSHDPSTEHENEPARDDQGGRADVAPSGRSELEIVSKRQNRFSENEPAAAEQQYDLVLSPPSISQNLQIPLPPPRVASRFRESESSPELFLSRELTWLAFNLRVLNEAQDSRNPLLERLRFVAIVGSNLDEFFMKRIGGLKQQVGAGIHETSVDGLTPSEQIAVCHEDVRSLEERSRIILSELLEELREHGVDLTTYDHLTIEEQAELRENFLENIYPLVTPQATDPAHPFPFISNLSLNLLVKLRYPGDPAACLARVKIPISSGVPRFLKLKGKNRFVRLEMVIARNLDLLFPGMEVENYSIFRVTRNANTEKDEETADDLLALIESELRDRKFAPIVRIEVSPQMESEQRGMLAAELGLVQDDIFEVHGMFGHEGLMELVDLNIPSLKLSPHHPVEHQALTTDRSIFHTVRDLGSILLHHPYVSFKTSVERFLMEASRDPKVQAIKMALYRTSEGTKAVDHLIEAARNGKQVAVVLELKARFDEAANIRWASRLEDVGVHVTYGVVGLKTHCKVTLVVRRDHDGLRRYAHIGTGNYHAGTARAYSDLGLLTSDPAIGSDLTELFNYLTTGYKPKRLYTKILPAPKGCRSALLNKIEREIELHSAESPGLIQMKMNALEDAAVTHALYRASQAGVKVELIIRDTCRLRPGIPGLSENIRVVSVVGRFLEHARIYHFNNAGNEEYYIGSADLMKRNLASRVEVLAPVESPALKKELRHFLDLQLNDSVSAWEMLHDGSYGRHDGSSQKEDGSQYALIEWHERRYKEANRLKRRKPQILDREPRRRS